MPYNPANAGVTPIQRIKPFTADWVGDLTAGGSSNLQTFIDARRPFRAKVATVAARNALTSPQDGDLVIVLDNGSGLTSLDRYKATGSIWVTVATEGGGTGSATYKTPVRIASTANLALSGLTAIDGVTPVAGDRVLAKNQTTASANGIYVAAAGAWARSSDADTSAEVLPDTLIFIEEGATQADTAWVLTTNATITLGTTSLAFAQVNAGSGAMSTPTVIGTGNGVNAAFTLPGTGSREIVWKGGAVQVGGGVNYTRSGATITFVAGNIPANGEPIVASSEVSPLAGTDAATLNGVASATTATANTIVKRDGVGDIAGTVANANTVGGVLPAVAATASTIVKRGTDATVTAANHASLGAAGAVGTAIVADATGKVPVVALPVATVGTNGVIQPDGTTITISSGVISAAPASNGSGIGPLTAAANPPVIFRLFRLPGAFTYGTTPFSSDGYLTLLNGFPWDSTGLFGDKEAFAGKTTGGPATNAATGAENFLLPAHGACTITKIEGHLIAGWFAASGNTSWSSVDVVLTKISAAGVQTVLSSQNIAVGLGNGTSNWTSAGFSISYGAGIAFAAGERICIQLNYHGTNTSTQTWLFPNYSAAPPSNVLPAGTAATGRHGMFAITFA